jgi:hypothetical protein
MQKVLRGFSSRRKAGRLMDELEAEFKEKDARLRAAHERELELYFCLFTMLQDIKKELPLIITVMLNLTGIITLTRLLQNL